MRIITHNTAMYVHTCTFIDLGNFTYHVTSTRLAH